MNLERDTEGSELFLKYDYPETKDLCKHFLTLVSGILTLSLTFSDKVIKIGNKAINPASNYALVASWTMFFLAIILCGIGLTILTLAGGNAVYAKSNYRPSARRSNYLIIAACILFVLGLLLLMISAGISIFYPSPIVPPN